MAPSNDTVLSTNSVTTQDIVFAVLFSFIVITGVPANYIIITIVRKTPSMHTTTNYLLMNLAVADLLTLLLCQGIYELLLKNVKLNKPLGDLICKLFAGNIILPITIKNAALTVCTIAVERYLALMKPYRSSLRLTKYRLRFVIPLLWVVAILCCVPDLLSNTFDSSQSAAYPCNRPWTLENYHSHKAFIAFTCIFFGFIPSIIVVFCYFEIFRGLFISKTICDRSKSSAEVKEDKNSKKQLFKLLLWLSLLFVACMLPFSVFFIYLITIDQTTVAKNHRLLIVMQNVFKFLLVSNSFWNPLLYALQSSNYQNAFKKIFCCKKLG